MDFVAGQSQLFFSQLLHLREEHKGCSVLSVPHAQHSINDCNVRLQKDCKPQILRDESTFLTSHCPRMAKE